MKFVQATVTIDLTVEFPVQSMRQVRSLAKDWEFVKQYVEHAEVGSVCLEHFEKVKDQARIQELQKRFPADKRWNALRFGLRMVGLTAARRT